MDATQARAAAGQEMNKMRVYLLSKTTIASPLAWHYWDRLFWFEKYQQRPYWPFLAKLPVKFLKLLSGKFCHYNLLDFKLKVNNQQI